MDDQLSASVALALFFCRLETFIDTSSSNAVTAGAL